jgi:alkyl hydroperoxide reductase subunit AhpC
VRLTPRWYPCSPFFHQVCAQTMLLTPGKAQVVGASVDNVYSHLAWEQQVGGFGLAVQCWKGRI